MANILVADDDQLLRAILRDHLEQAGHAVLEAGDGIAAVELALAERPEVLLLDVMMPLARGLEVVRRVREEDAWHPAIVMVSARTRVTDRLNALEAGADAYVEKPFAPDDVLALVERAVDAAPPARFVDVLGPVWAALAIERLAAAALQRRTTARVGPDQVEELFAGVVARVLGRTPGEDPRHPAFHVMRLLWEGAIRVLLRDATEPVPVVRDLGLPDALAAVERAIADEVLARHGRRTGTPVIHRFWGGILSHALGAGSAMRAADGPHGGDPAVSWSAVLAAALGRPPDVDPGPALDPLQLVWLAAAARPANAKQPA